MFVEIAITSRGRRDKSKGGDKDAHDVCAHENENDMENENAPAARQ